jgi:hypothetical protein
MSESINVRMAKVPDELTSREIRFLLQSILTDLAAIAVAVNTHTHDGVTVGSGTSDAANANTVGTLNTTV